MLKLFLLFATIFLGFHQFSYATPPLKPIVCSESLQNYLKKMVRLPEVREIIATVQQEGPLYFVADDHPLSQQFGAYWDIDGRSICVNLTSCASEGEIIGSILFELHNALINQKLNHLDSLASQGKIGREDYIRSIEYLEYENSLKAAHLAKKGIELGIFPHNAALFTYKDFEEHYYYQKIGGHSSWVGKSYDQLANK